MPSPLGHALGGIATGWLVDGRRQPLGEAAVYAGVGMAPDLDLLLGMHSTYTHSVGAVAVVTALAWTLRGRRRARWALACGAALASHILLDWLGSDTTPPLGIMALWPLSSAFYQAPWHLFPAVSRRFHDWVFVVQNTRAVVVEMALLLPLTIAVGWWRGRAPR